MTLDRLPGSRTSVVQALALLLLVLPAPSHAQFVPLDFSLADSQYNVTDQPIGTTGVSYSMSRIIDNSSLPPPTIGLADGTIQFAGNCEDCGPTVRLVFSGPVSLQFTGMDTVNTGYWFDENDSWMLSAPGATFVLTDPNSELGPSTIIPGSISFSPSDNCYGIPNPCTTWTITTGAVSILHIQFLAENVEGNGSGLKISAAPAPSPGQFVPLDFSPADSQYNVTGQPIGTTGVSYSMSRIIDNSSLSPPTIGLADGTIQFEGDCEDCGPTVRLVFSGPVSLQFTGMYTINTGYWFDENDSWMLSAPGATFVLADPNSELGPSTIIPGSISFSPSDNCYGIPNPCTTWTITTGAVSILYIQFLAENVEGNGSGLKISAAPVPSALPALTLPAIAILSAGLLGLGGLRLHETRRRGTGR